MCGRFAFYSPHESIVRMFGLSEAAPEVEPRYNIAPTQYVAAVREDEQAVRTLAMLYWGLVPFWAKEKALGARMINARAESLREKPSFREAYRRRRCLILANGYYEWRRQATGKQPWFIRLASEEPFAMAGLWERWRDRSTDERLESCTIVTTSPAPAIADIHDRMPVILPPSAYAAWLDPRSQDVAVLDALLVPTQQELSAVAVSRRVNNARNEGPDLIEPEPDASG